MLCIARFSFKNLLFLPLFPKIACLACSYAAKNDDRTSGFAKKICLNVESASCQVKSVNDLRFFS